MRKTASGANVARYELGDLTIVALRDGYLDMPPERLLQEDGRPFGPEPPKRVSLVDGRLRLSVNAFLIVGKGRHILIDTGAGNAWDPSMGLLLDALAEAGVAREDIGTVALTHTHADHVNGLVAPDGTDAFPSLERIFVPQEEISLFDGSGRLGRFRERCVAFGEGFPISESVTAVGAHGHSAGHTAFEVASGGETLLVWGDVVHVPSIQFARPKLAWEFDADRTQARSTRERLLDRVARPGVHVAGAHLDFPGIGSVTRAKEAYCFSPA